MIHTLVTVGRQEGVMSLFTGAKFALLRQGTYGTIRLGKFIPTGSLVLEIYTWFLIFVPNSKRYFSSSMEN